MNNVQLLNSVADAVEKSIKQGYTCNWFAGNVRRLQEYKTGCPGLLYGLQNDLLGEIDALSDNLLLDKISSLTNGLCAYLYNQSDLPAIQAIYSKDEAYSLQTPEDIRTIAKLLEDGLIRSKY